MDELFEELGLDADAPVAKAVQKVQTLKQKLEDKDTIMQGLQQKVSDLEDQFDSLADGVAEARVKDLVQKVQHETGRHVGKDNMETLQAKAARYLFASEGERESIYNDMKAHTIAYGTKVGMSEKIDALQGGRSKEDNGQSKEFNQAKALIDSGDAKDWDEAYQMVQQNRTATDENDEE